MPQGASHPRLVPLGCGAPEATPAHGSVGVVFWKALIVGLLRHARKPWAAGLGLVAALPVPGGSTWCLRPARPRRRVGPSTRECSALLPSSVGAWPHRRHRCHSVGVGAPASHSAALGALQLRTGPCFSRYLMLCPDFLVLLSGVLPVVTAAHPEVAATRSFQAHPYSSSPTHQLTAGVGGALRQLFLGICSEWWPCAHGRVAWKTN